MILWFFFGIMVSVALIVVAAIFLWRRTNIKGELVQAEQLPHAELMDDEVVTRVCPEKTHKPDPVAFMHKKCV